MNITILPLNPETLSLAPQLEGYPFSCKTCLYWESPDFSKDLAPGWESRAFLKKKGFIEDLSLQFGPCGKILTIDGVGVGFSLYGPPSFFPNSLNYPSGPLTPGAILLACLFIPQGRFQREGLGKMLLSEVLEDLKGRGYKRVETFARRGNPDNPSGPLDFYLKRGFSIIREDCEYPLVGVWLG